MPSGGLFADKTWRVASEPFRLPPLLAKELERLGYRLLKFLRACDLLYVQSIKGTAPRWIAEVLDAGKPPEVIALGRERSFRGELPAVIRPDVIPTPGGYILSEIDSVPGGIGLTAWLNEAYSAEGFPVLGGSRGMLSGFSSILPGGADIFVSQEASSYRPEMEWLADSLRSQDAGSYTVRDESWQGDWHAQVYRFFELFDLPNLPSTQGLFSAAKAGDLRITAPPKAYLEEKLWFALFWLKPLESYWRRELGSGVFTALRQSIPRSWLLDPTPLPPQAVYPGIEINAWKELETFSQKQRQLVIKVSGFSEKAWGARGVTVGHDVSTEAWKTALQNALNHFAQTPCILQEFHAGALFPVPFLRQEVNELEVMQARARICPYYFVANQEIHLGGALATLCPADKKLLHGMRDAVLCPVS